MVRDPFINLNCVIVTRKCDTYNPNSEQQNSPGNLWQLAKPNSRPHRPFGTATVDPLVCGGGGGGCGLAGSPTAGGVVGGVVGFCGAPVEGGVVPDPVLGSNFPGAEGFLLSHPN